MVSVPPPSNMVYCHKNLCKSCLQLTHNHSVLVLPEPLSRRQSIRGPCPLVRPRDRRGSGARDKRVLIERVEVGLVGVERVHVRVLPRVAEGRVRVEVVVAAVEGVVVAQAGGSVCVRVVQVVVGVGKSHGVQPGIEPVVDSIP